MNHCYTATDCTKIQPVSNQSLEHYARVYQDNKKIKQRMTFDEFMANPELFINLSAAWPETVWVVTFTEYGNHKKMWVNDTLTYARLACEVIRCDDPASVVKYLGNVMLKHGEPEYVHIENAEGFNRAATKGLLLSRSINFEETPNKARLEVELEGGA